MLEELLKDTEFLELCDWIVDRLVVVIIDSIKGKRNALVTLLRRESKL